MSEWKTVLYTEDKPDSICVSLGILCYFQRKTICEISYQKSE